jgi:hypothetical protein
MPTPNAGPFNHAGMMLVASGKGLYMGYGVPQTGPTPASGVAVVPLNDPDATIEVSIVSRRNDASAVAADFIAAPRSCTTPTARTGRCSFRCRASPTQAGERRSRSQS